MKKYALCESSKISEFLIVWPALGYRVSPRPILTSPVSISTKIYAHVDIEHRTTMLFSDFFQKIVKITKREE